MEAPRELSPDRGTLVPARPQRLPTAPRVIGPGRLERAYRERIGALERELDTARLVERGAHSRLDRLERRLARARVELEEAEQLERRLVLALGCLTGENAELRRRLAQLEALEGGALPSLPPAPVRGFFARFLRMRARTGARSTRA